LNAIWAVDCAEVVTVLMEKGSVYNVVLAPGATWKRIDFEKGVGYLQQEKLIAKGSTNYVKQSLYFELYGLSNEKRNALEDLNGVCCMNVIAEDQSGKYHYLGITRDAAGDIENEGLKTGDGSSETGANPATDIARYTESMVCYAGFYAPITVDPNSYSSLFWTLPVEQFPTETFWTLPVEQFPDGGSWTIKN
jgi:hypothetical protein